MYDATRLRPEKACLMKLYVTLTSPYARLARILVVEKKLQDRVEIIEAKTRTAGSPYYAINPSGRVPYLVDDAGVGMEDSQLVCAYLDGLDSKPSLRHALDDGDWPYRRFEATARSLCDGISVWVREMSRPENERSPTVLAHEVARSQRMADFFAALVNDPLMNGPPSMGQLLLAVSLESASKRGPADLTVGRPALSAWLRRLSDYPAMRATALK
jgi:glutathione S-transferase